MDPDVIRLADALDDLASFLVAHAEPTWGEWIAKDASSVRRGDGYGVTHFLSAFGGMGSLNDVAFHPMNGNAASIPEAEELNRQLRNLVSKAWTQADALRRAAQE